MEGTIVVPGSLILENGPNNVLEGLARKSAKVTDGRVPYESCVVRVSKEKLTSV